jgi:hypothetical protein
VRIPHLEYQDTFDANDPHAWISTPWSESVQNVQSLVGDVVHGINRTFTGNTTFNVTSSYQKFNVWHPSSEWSRLKWLVQCSPWEYLNQDQEDHFSTVHEDSTDVLDNWALDQFGSNFSLIKAKLSFDSTNPNTPKTAFIARTWVGKYRTSYP